MCFCTGSPTGNYQKAAEAIARQLGQGLRSHTRFVNTNGSLDNLNNVASGQCSIGIAQSDVYDLWRTESSNANAVLPLRDLYTEYVHILCPASAKIDDLDDLATKKATLIIGPPGSGTAETWRSLRQVDDKKYGNANIDVSSDPADAGSVQAVKASAGKPHPVCMLWISGLNSTAMQNANERSLDPATGKPVMQLISVNDKRMAKLPGREGPRYTVREIKPSKGSAGKPGFYDNLINNGGIFSGAGIDVLAVPAGLFMNKEFKDALSRDNYNQLSTAIDDASGGLRKEMSPGS
jgi:TRAP-type uncharacterized transport system substrate-binding protein